MEIKKKQLNLLLLFLLASPIVYAQTVAVNKIELAGEKIVVYYSLEDSNPYNEYQISLYSSQNNFAAALAKVSGDVGNEIKPGAEKKIEWSVLDEIGPYKGKLSLEVRGHAFVSVAKINNISIGDKFKRGKSRVILWKPGSSNRINIELLKGSDRISGELNLPNNGSFNLHIPEHAGLGKDYTIRITDAGHTENVTTSLPFTVKRKLPLIVKVLPLLAIGGALTLLKGKTAESGGGNTASAIPDPPALPGS